jgi:hypothetical protein
MYLLPFLLQRSKVPQMTTEELLNSLLARTNYTGNIHTVVSDYLRLEARIRRVSFVDPCKSVNIL